MTCPLKKKAIFKLDKNLCKAYNLSITLHDEGANTQKPRAHSVKLELNDFSVVVETKISPFSPRSSLDLV
jgi:hypothetical protein